MSSSTSRPISIKVTHRETTHVISVLPQSSIGDFQRQLAELTSVEPALQKLLYKGKKPFRDGDEMRTTVEDAGLRDGIKVQMLGSTADELGAMKATESKMGRIMREREMRMLKASKTKTRSTATQSSTYTFNEIRPLPHLPDPSASQALLHRLANDPAIKHVMNLHQFSVGLLSELGPDSSPNLLGLNTNAGQKIELRLRTHALDGFRLYKGIRQVLCHELAHNVHGDHNTEFQALNSLLNREVAEYERSVRENSHSLSTGDVYEPAQEAEAYGHILGGGNTSLDRDESLDERRRRILEATISRLRKEEEEIENGCGTTGSAN